MQQPELLLSLGNILISLLFWNCYIGYPLSSVLNLKFYFLFFTVYKVLPGPQYNLLLINVYNPVRSLCSADSGFLVVPACNKSWGGADLCTCGAITLELITTSFKKYIFKRVIQNWVENLPFSWVLNLLSCVCIPSSLNVPWAYHLWIRRNINYIYYYY